MYIICDLVYFLVMKISNNINSEKVILNFILNINC